MTSLDSNFRDLLSCLNSAGARYLVLGGYAVNIYGYHRNTKDLDIWIATDAENAPRVAEALRGFGFSARSVRGSMFRRTGDLFTFGREPFRVDLLTSPSGVEFEACYRRRIVVDIDGLPIPVIALKDLLVNKAASGRPRDLDDVQSLGKKGSTIGGQRRSSASKKRRRKKR